MIIITFFNFNKFKKFMNLKFSWFVCNQLQDWIVSKKPYYPNLEECVNWVKDKLKREGSNYNLTKEDLEDIEIAFEFQTSDVNQRSLN